MNRRVSYSYPLTHSGAKFIPMPDPQRCVLGSSIKLFIIKHRGASPPDKHPEMGK